MLRRITAPLYHPSTNSAGVFCSLFFLRKIWGKITTKKKKQNKTEDFFFFFAPVPTFISWREGSSEEMWEAQL